MKRMDLIGQTFGKLTVIELSEKNGRRRSKNVEVPLQVRQHHIHQLKQTGIRQKEKLRLRESLRAEKQTKA